MIKVLALFALISVVYASVDYAARGLPTEVEWHKCVLSATNPVESLPGTNFVSAEFHLLSAVNTVLTVSSYSEALELSKQNGKPIVVLFTKPWCGACKNLKSQMQGAENFFSVAAKYNMVNVEEDSEVSFFFSTPFFRRVATHFHDLTRLNSSLHPRFLYTDNFSTTYRVTTSSFEANKS